MKKLTIEICSDSRIDMTLMLNEIIRQVEKDYNEGLGKNEDCQYHFIVKEIGHDYEYELFVRT